MERTQKTWILEIVVAAVVAAMLAALLGLWGWTANKVVQNGERIVEVKAELGREIAELNAKMDLLIRGLNISVAPKESASAEPSGADRGGFQVGAGGTATE